jgi:hypothetical protein
MGSPTLRNAMFDLCGIQKVSRTPEIYYLIAPYVVTPRLKHAVLQQMSNL